MRNLGFFSDFDIQYLLPRFLFWSKRLGNSRYSKVSSLYHAFPALGKIESGQGYMLEKQFRTVVFEIVIVKDGAFGYNDVTRFSELRTH